jgi:hypothetical protein
MNRKESVHFLLGIASAALVLTLMLNGPGFRTVAQTPTDSPVPPTPTPSNLPPIVTVGQAKITVDEGMLAVNSGTTGDPDGFVKALAASTGSVTGNLDGTWQWEYRTSDGPSQSQTVTIWAIDGSGAQSSTAFDLAVVTVAPVVGPLIIAPTPRQTGTPISVTAIFTEPGVLDVHYAVIAWGDGSACSTAPDPEPNSPSDCSLTEGIPTGSVEGWHAYDVPGIYAVQLTVFDKDGGTGTSSPEAVIVYDSDGGFVTGGGWIDSPEGAYKANPSLTGRASFGFVSKYKRGTTIPTGETEFKFRAGDLNFHSDNYEWLVVAGVKAMYKGVGTINGEGKYRFILSAIDADLKDSDSFAVDRFRIRIWLEDELGAEVVIYDNGSDDDNDEAMTEIGGGSIVIHTK